MTYQETIEFLEISNWMGSRLGLSRMQELLHLLGDPHKQLQYVHITGTNGKGSTAAMLESVLRAAGYHTGLYTSPHLIRYNERMKIDGKNVSDEDMQRAADLMAVQIEKMEDKPTVFERITVMALLIFALKRCEIVVLEVGLGGRLDATNVIEAPECSVITNMDLEHTQVLGNTIEEIAAEKAGISKPGCPVVLYAQSEAAESVVRAKAVECGSRFFKTDPSKIRVLSRSLKGQIFDYRQRKNVRIALPGNYQLRNASTVLDTVDVLTSRGWSIPEQAVYEGMRNAVWAGRFQVLHEEPLVLLDGAHNPNGAGELAQCLDSYLPGQKLTLMMGVMADKDYRSMLDIMMPYAGRVFCVTPPSDRSLPSAELARIIREDYGVPAADAGPSAEGIAKAFEACRETDILVVFGSLYQAGDVLEYFGKEA